MNLNQVTVPVLNLSISIPFYEALGLKLIVHTHADYARFECPDGGSTFSLHRIDTLPTGEGTWVYFECEDLDKRVKYLVSKGLNFDLLPTDQTWKWREAHLRDPDNNKIILYFAGENRRYPPWRKVDA